MDFEVDGESAAAETGDEVTATMETDACGDDGTAGVGGEDNRATDRVETDAGGELARPVESGTCDDCAMDAVDTDDEAAAAEGDRAAAREVDDAKAGAEAVGSAESAACFMGRKPNALTGAEVRTSFPPRLAAAFATVDGRAALVTLDFGRSSPLRLGSNAAAFAPEGFVRAAPARGLFVGAASVGGAPAEAPTAPRLAWGIVPVCAGNGIEPVGTKFVSFPFEDFVSPILRIDLLPLFGSSWFAPGKTAMRLAIPRGATSARASMHPSRHENPGSHSHRISTFRVAIVSDMSRVLSTSWLRSSRLQARGASQFCFC